MENVLEKLKLLNYEVSSRQDANFLGVIHVAVHLLVKWPTDCVSCVYPRDCPHHPRV